MDDLFIRKKMSKLKKKTNKPGLRGQNSGGTYKLGLKAENLFQNVY